MNNSQKMKELFVTSFIFVHCHIYIETRHFLVNGFFRRLFFFGRIRATFFLGAALPFSNNLSFLRDTTPGALSFNNRLFFLRDITPVCFECIRRYMKFSMPNTIKDNIMPKSKRNRIGAAS